MSTSVSEIVFVVGLPGSGKSHIATSRYAKHALLDSNDPEEVDEMFEDVLNVGWGRWAIDEYSTAEGTITRINRAKAAGYRTKLVLAHCSTKACVERRPDARDEIFDTGVEGACLSFVMAGCYADELEVIRTD